MNDQNNQSPGRKPDFVAYNVRDSKGGNGKGHWNRIGSAWRHRDGQGYDIALDSLPVDGRVTLRELREERMQDYGNQRQEAVPTQGQGYAQGPDYGPQGGTHHGRGR